LVEDLYDFVDLSLADDEGWTYHYQVSILPIRTALRGISYQPKLKRVFPDTPGDILF
jgi:hypothetical protein